MDRRHWLGLLGPIKNWLRANGHEGVDCPCCGQFVKFYKRRMNATLARCLIWIVTYYEINCDSENPWVAVYEKGPRFVVRQGGYGAGMLANWGLIDRESNERTLFAAGEQCERRSKSGAQG